MIIRLAWCAVTVLTRVLWRRHIVVTSGVLFVVFRNVNVWQTVTESWDLYFWQLCCEGATSSWEAQLLLTINIITTQKHLLSDRLVRSRRSYQGLRRFHNQLKVLCDTFNLCVVSCVDLYFQIVDKELWTVPTSLLTSSWSLPSIVSSFPVESENIVSSACSRLLYPLFSVSSLVSIWLKTHQMSFKPLTLRAYSAWCMWWHTIHLTTASLRSNPPERPAPLPPPLLLSRDKPFKVQLILMMQIKDRY